jgi:hypothetical protein
LSRTLAVSTLLFALVLAPPVFAQHHSSGSHSHSSSSKSKSTKSKGTKSKSKSSGGTVHVQGYYRKDGTYVHEYDRSAPDTANSSHTSTPTPRTTIHAYRKNYVAQGFTPHSSVTRDSHGKIKRSKAAKDAFKREHPCPSTGSATGACRGYVVDHVNPLECGGADAPSNMQWQTVAAGKAKDKTERACRQ